MFYPRPMGEYVMVAQNPKLPTQPQNAYIDGDKSMDKEAIDVTKEAEVIPDVATSPTVDVIPNVATNQVAADSPAKKKRNKKKNKSEAKEQEISESALVVRDMNLPAPSFPASTIPTLPEPDIQAPILKEGGVEPEKRTRTKSLVVREEEENKAARATVDINTTKIWVLDKAQLIGYINHHRGITDSKLWDDTIV